MKTRICDWCGADLTHTSCLVWSGKTFCNRFCRDDYKYEEAGSDIDKEAERDENANFHVSS